MKRPYTCMHAAEGPTDNEKHPKWIGSLQRVLLLQTAVAVAVAVLTGAAVELSLRVVPNSAFPSVLVLPGFELPSLLRLPRQSFKVWRRPAASSTSKRMRTAW